MDAYKLVVKVFAKEGCDAGKDDFVGAFHRWIQSGAVKDHLLVDVADYHHVHEGPGTVLVGLEANFSTDRADGRLGLMYSRKRPAAGGLRDRLRQALLAVLEGCQRLETDEQLGGRVRFRTDRLRVQFADRLLAPNDPETYALVRDQVQSLCDAVYGREVRLTHERRPGELLELGIEADGAPEIGVLVERLRRMAVAGERAEVSSQ